MKTTLHSLLLLLTLALAGCATAPHPHRSAHQTTELIQSNGGIVLTGGQRLVTPSTFHPPVEITIVAKTDFSNLRIGYTADQVIFNWEMEADQLRVDGGPANGCHQTGAGRIPIGKFVTIRWLVTPHHEAIYVDGALRFEHHGDYSDINKAVSVFTAAGSKVTVKSLKVKPLIRATP